MKNITALIIICGLLAGCVKSEPVPIAYNCPKIKLPAAPDISYLNKLNDKSSPADIVKAWIAAANAYHAWAIAVRRQVEKS